MVDTKSTHSASILFSELITLKMLQLRQKLMNLMDKQYQGRDGITDEIDLEEEVRKATRFL